MNTKNHHTVSYLVAVAATLSLGLVSSDVLAEATKKLPEELPKMVKGVKVQFKSTPRPVAKVTKAVPAATLNKAKAIKAISEKMKVTPEQANTAINDLQMLLGAPGTFTWYENPYNQTSTSSLGMVKADKVYLKAALFVQTYDPQTKEHQEPSDYTTFIPLKEVDATVSSVNSITATCKNDTACILMADGSLKKQASLWISNQSASSAHAAIILPAATIALNTLTRFANAYKAP